MKRSSFLKALLGISIAPKVLAEVAVKKPDFIPVVWPENPRKYPLTVQKCVKSYFETGVLYYYLPNDNVVIKYDNKTNEYKKIS